jgi:hypothetical protein
MSSSPTDFYSVMSQVAVSLLALLFVSFQIAHKRWVKSTGRKILAIQTSFEFMTPLLFSLCVILPTNTFILFGIKIVVWKTGGVIIGAIGLIIACWFVIYAWRHPKNRDIFVKRQLALQLVAIFFDYIPIMIWSILGRLDVVSLWMIWMLVSGSVETWLFFSESDSKRLLKRKPKRE